MNELEATAGAQPMPSVLTTANIVYGLHSFAIAVGIFGAASVIGSFLGGVPSILGVILNYAKRSDARGTWVESHYRWQIRTFWYALLWVIVGGVLAVTLIGIPIAIGLFAFLTAWLIYRIARGWLRLRYGKPMYA